jgi:hypothetical protein
MKALALAAALLLVAVVAAVVLPSYLRHQRVRQAEEPIGVPVGVPEPVASASSVAVNAPPAPEMNQVPTDVSIAKTNVPEDAPASAPPESAPVTAPKQVAAAPVEPAGNAPADSAPSNAPKEVAAAPAQPAMTAPPVNVQTEERPLVAANNPVEPSEKKIAPEPARSVDAKVKKPKPNRDDIEVASAIPTARPVSPEVRRAEPAPPAEGPEEVAKNDPETEPAVPNPVRSEKRTENSRTKAERTAKTKRESEKDATRRIRVVDEADEVQTAIPPSPDGRVRARFIGVTPEGNWMFALPSKKIVILPPPPGG